MLDFETFSREAWDLIGRKVAKRAWLAETYAMAAESIGLPVSLESTAIAMFRLQLSRQVQLNMERKQLDEAAQRLLLKMPIFALSRLRTGADLVFIIVSGVPKFVEDHFGNSAFGGANLADSSHALPAVNLSCAHSTFFACI
jgi:hypothetical protein